MTKLIFGCGYLGHRVATRWLASGDEVFVVTRSATRAAEFERQGLQTIVADVAVPATLAGGLPVAETVLYSIGYDRVAGRSRKEVQIAGLQAALDALPEQTGRIIYISSTGVYGQTSGEWVDEDTPCQPTREAGTIGLAAEQLLAGHPLGPRSFILRLAGLYGPGRIPHRRDLEAGHTIAASPDGHLNLIHVDDAVEVILAAEDRGRPRRLYLVSDGHPVRRRDYFSELARLLQTPLPRFEPPPPAELALSRSGSNKRISNARLMSELQPRLAYSSYIKGLAAIVASSY